MSETFYGPKVISVESFERRVENGVVLLQRNGFQWFRELDCQVTCVFDVGSDRWREVVYKVRERLSGDTCETRGLG
jgi:hypothetical protein